MHNNLKNLVSTFISNVIEGIAQDVTERIDTIDNVSVQQIATDTIVDYDYTDIVTDTATDVVDNYDFSSIVEDGIDDYDFSDTIDERVDYRVDLALDGTDFSSYIDFNTNVKHALEELDVKADCEQFDARLKALEHNQRDILLVLRNASSAFGMIPADRTKSIRPDLNDSDQA
jgi:galactitol-specific phosphotransferase system IIB component